MCVSTEIAAPCGTPSALLESLPNENFRASSEHSSGRAAAHRSRLSTQFTDDFSEVWLPLEGTPTLGEWIEVDLGATRSLSQLELHPRTEYDFWVTSYKLAFSLDGENFEFLRTVNGDERIFKGPTGMGQGATVLLNETEASGRYVRLYPQTVFQRVAVKWEMYACIDGE